MEDSHFSVWYYPGDLPAGSTLPADVLAWMNDARGVYTQLGFRYPDEQVYVTLGKGGLGSALNLFGQPTIYLPIDKSSPYLCRHELFHIVQYQYIWNPLASANKFWMEATAQWAAHIAQIVSPTYAVSTEYSEQLSSYLDRANERWDKPDGFGGPRQYGAFILAEYLGERFGGAGGGNPTPQQEADVIKDTWLRASGWATSATDAIREVSEARGARLDTTLEHFWKSAFFLEWNQSQPSVGFRDPDMTQWRSRLQLGRPQHATADFASGLNNSGEQAVGPGGVMYVELRKPAWTNGRVRVEITTKDLPAAPVFLRASVLRSAPGPYPLLCPSATMLDPDGTALVAADVLLSDDCPTAVLVVYHTLADGPNQPRDVRWSATFRGTGKAFDNGTVRLGSGKWATLGDCANYDDPNGAVVPIYLQLNGLTGGPWGDDNVFEDECAFDGWGMGDLNGQSGHISWIGSYSLFERHWDASAHNMTVEGFIGAADQAWSFVRIGDEHGFRVTHNYKQSPVPNLYQVDVTVQNLGTTTTGQLRYRRSNLFNDDGLSNWTWDGGAVTFAKTTPAAQANYLLFSSDYGWGGATDPKGPYAAVGAIGYFTDHVMPEYGRPDFQQLGYAVVLDLGRLAPQSSLSFTLFYGAAADEATALASVTSVGAQVYFLGQPITPDGTPIDGFVNGIFAIDGRNLPNTVTP